MKKKQLDQIYQSAVDFEASKLFTFSIDDIKNRNDYGSVEVKNDGIEINIGWWKMKINENCYHIVFKSSRKLFLGFHKCYLSGIKIVNSTIENLSDDELGDYD